MNLKFFDVHAHVQFAAFDNDREAVIERALAEGIGLINVGTAKNTSEAAVNLAQKSDHLYAVIGLHPIHAAESFYDDSESKDKNLSAGGESFDYGFYKKLGENKKVVAIGECGFDFYRVKNEETITKQKGVFTVQIDLARELEKPLMIHCRNAFKDLIYTLQNSKLPNPPGVIHFFSGNKDDARKLLDLGFAFAFGGVITFVRDYDEVIKFIPSDKILSETDAPYVTPAPYRGKRNEPAYVVEVVKKLAELKNISLDKMAEQILVNVKNIFQLS